jgi:hypothetical protein
MTTTAQGPSARRSLLGVSRQDLQQSMLGLATSSGTGARGFGQSIELAWKGLSKDVQVVSDLPLVRKLMSDGDEISLSNVVVHGAQALGLGAAALTMGAGALELADGKDVRERLDGCLDVATGGVIAETLLGSAPMALMLAPFAAAFGLMRGACGLMNGNENADPKQATQGLLEGARAVSIACARFGRLAQPLAEVGSVIGGVAAGMQLVRGGIELDQSVKAHSLKGEVEGLSDMGISAGLVLTATGIGAVPGVALMAVAAAAPLLYSVSTSFRGWADRELDAHQQGLKSAVSHVESLTKPIVSSAKAAWSGLVYG